MKVNPLHVHRLTLSSGQDNLIEGIWIFLSEGQSLCSYVDICAYISRTGDIQGRPIGLQRQRARDPRKCAWYNHSHDVEDSASATIFEENAVAK